MRAAGHAAIVRSRSGIRRPGRYGTASLGVPGIDRVMSDRGKGRLVYSTGVGSICPGCGWPETRLQVQQPARRQRVGPDRIVAKLRMEKKGRGGKTVTVVDGLPRNAAFLKELCQELKRACGTGGAVDDGAIELQGDLRDRVRELLMQEGISRQGMIASASMNPALYCACSTSRSIVVAPATTSPRRVSACGECACSASLCVV